MGAAATEINSRPSPSRPDELLLDEWRKDHLRRIEDGMADPSADIGYDMYWHEGQPIYAHKAFNHLPRHWPHWEQERAIRLLQGLRN